MRARRWLTWLVFAICAIAVLEALGWMTWQSLRLERAERAARAEAEFQETIRSALWRMESEITPLLFNETVRPYFEYRSFYSDTGTYASMWQDSEGPSRPSPLLKVVGGPFVKLYFQLEPDRQVTSPQVPAPEQRALAERYVDREFLVLGAERLAELRSFIRAGFALRPLAQPSARLEQSLEGGASPQAALYQQRQSGDYEARQQAASNAKLGNEALKGGKAVPQQDERFATETGDVALKDTPPRSSADAGDVRTGPFSASWLSNAAAGEQELVLFRSVELREGTFEQGMWMDWPALRERLRTVVHNLLPDADLVPANERVLRTASSSHLLASIPVLLVPGSPPALAGHPAELAGPGLTPTKVTLLVTWLAVLAAVAAIAVVLRKSMELSDRRGRFVSAVTHELRTPLTTFCLYTEMLSDGMVQDEASRRGYLATLKGESRRLAGIVENVLEYARLGGKKPAKNGPTIFARDLVARMEPALKRCAEQGSMDLVVEGMPDPTLRVSADQQTVERIMLNLVDNACKYAADAADRRVHLRAGSLARAGRAYLELRVRDHGPGIPPVDAARIFKPFQRARRDAGAPRSGLGLGLALARGLARELGGDLALGRPEGPGAEFVVTLPA
jgi:signal transduction histidine kinase